MSPSHAEAHDITCPHCGTTFTGDVWLIVDVDERPDLPEAVLEGRIHDLTCPACRQVAAAVKAPLLLYRPRRKTVLVFSPAEGTPPEQIAAQSKALLASLRQRLGAAWHDDWTRTAMATALRSSLPGILADIEEEDEDISPEEARRREELIGAFRRLVEAADLAEAAEVLDAYPDLVSAEIARSLARLSGTYEKAGDPTRAQVVLERFGLVHARFEMGASTYRAVRAAEADPELRAILSTLLDQRQGGDSAQIIALCAQALGRVDRVEMPDLWALLQAATGDALLSAQSSDRADIVERAVGAYQAALRVYRPETAASEWIRVMIGLANALQERLQGDRAENFETALAMCEAVLEHLRRHERPRDWARLIDSMGNAYADRIRGDRAENLEKAIECFEQARDGSREGTPGWVASTNNLARAHYLRLLGDRAANVDRAIELYELVAAQLDPQNPSTRSDWALAMDNMGAAYASRLTGDTEENLERSIWAYEQALTVRTRDAEPFAWAWTRANLGSSYAQRRRGAGRANVEHAIRCFEDSLEVFDPESMPLRWAAVQVELGTACLEPVLGDRPDLQTKARHAFEAALEVFTPETLPVECRRTAYKLGVLHQRQGDWAASYRVLALGARAAEALFGSAYAAAGQQIEVSTNADLYDRLVIACARLSDDPDYARRGLVHAEEGKARTFLAQMGQADFRPPAGAPPEVLRAETALAVRLRQIDQALVRPQEPVVERRLAAERVKVRAELDRTWATIAASGSDGEEYAAQRRGLTPTWDDLAALVDRLGPGARLVEFYLSDEEITVFCLRDGMTQPAVASIALSRQTLLDRYLAAYEREVLNYYATPAVIERTDSWLDLGDALLAPIAHLLREAAIIYLVPHGWLHTVPLHALTFHGKPLIARCPVVYAASAGVLARVLETEMSGGRALVLGYTPSQDPVERHIFLSEAQEVAERFNTTALTDDLANGDALRRGTGAGLVHLSCHGYFNRDDPLASGVMLNDGVFTARDWMGLRHEAELMTLSACESGFSRVGRGDEIASLSRALLGAGAATTLLTLWTVNAQTTKEWMLDFYDACWDSQGRRRMPKALAFQQATLALRARYPSPVFWGPFVLIGSGQ